MRLPVVGAMAGYFLRLFSMAFVAPLALAIWDNDVSAAGHFLLSAAVTVTAGYLGGLHVPPGQALQRAEALGVVSVTWALLGLFGCLPYVMEGLSFADALFESMSGFTTTGATVLTDFSEYGRAFFLWRAMSQWFGGLGVIALFVVMLPRLGIAGRQLFFAEASGAPSEAVSPQIRHAAGRIWRLYGGMTLVLIALLAVAGFPAYDALVHALTTISAGGFSSNPESIAGYANPAAEWILVFFMLLSGSSFPLLWLAVSRSPLVLGRDREFVVYVLAIVAGALILSVQLSGGWPSTEALRMGAFQAASIASSTGFASTDYNGWPDASRIVIVMLMVVGGCAGSAAGGPKVVRWILFFKHVRRQVILTLHRRAVVPIRHKGQVVPDSVMSAVIALVFLYVLGYFVFGTVLTMMGTDMVTAFSAAIACLGNVGPAFGDAGPMGNFGGFSDASKLLLTLAMWVGRLEILSVLTLLHPSVWRNTTFLPSPQR